MVFYLHEKYGSEGADGMSDEGMQYKTALKQVTSSRLCQTKSSDFWELTL